MIRDNYLNDIIDKKLALQNTEERAAHIPSGRLSASQLGLPLQWQILKTLGVPPRPIDAYTLRKFLRGREIEKWLVAEMVNLIEQQKEVYYRGVVGKVDAIVNSEGYGVPCGIVPHEVKSVSNAKFKRINERGQADRGHMLQAGLYAMATEATHFVIDYVASDDLRILSFVYKLEKDLIFEIDQTIDAYDKQIALRQVPLFEAKEAWQADSKYQQYPEWAILNANELELAIKIHYGDAWEKIKV